MGVSSRGLHPLRQIGLAAYLTHLVRSYTQTQDTIRPADAGLTPYPIHTIPLKATENLIWAGAQLTKQQGSLLRYEATADSD